MHNQAIYIGYMFRLQSHIQAYFCHLSHKMLRLAHSVYTRKDETCLTVREQNFISEY